MAAAPSNAAVASAPRGGTSFLTQYFLLILFGSGMVTMWVNSRHEAINPIQAFQDKHFIVASLGRLVQRLPPKRTEDEELTKDGHPLAGLDCRGHGGPSNEIAAEMVYWSDIPSDGAHLSPFYSPEKYLTFEPDKGGWNNIRMSMETVLAMAVAMGRTLVLPPEQGMYLLNKHKGGNGNQKKHFSFNDFYHLESVAKEHGGLNIITMDEFLEKEAMTGNLKDKDGKVLFPPGNTTNFNGRGRKDLHLNDLHKFLRTVSHWPDWDPETCLAAFPASKEHKDAQILRDLKKKIETGGWEAKFIGKHGYKEFVGKPNPVDSDVETRAKENWAERETLCIYDEKMQESPLVHFGYDDDDDDGYDGAGARLLVHFYAFLLYQDWRHDLWLKRFVRDHVRYVDDIQCAAARVVNAVRERARKNNPKSNGEFDAFHIRRGDFQYTVTRFDADKIYRVSQNELTANATIYIGTDERDKSFFKPLADHYDVVFLDDYKHLIEDVNSNFYGMLDQLITSRSRIFFGCWFSTFTSYITRLRGYHAAKEKLPGHQEGTLPTTYYYALEEHKLRLHTFHPVKKTFHSREYPTAWRGIDKGIGELNMAAKS